ncbi:MAG: SRPBCC family protein [Bacteroidota bacterium]
MELHFNRQIELNIPTDKAWEILWNNYENVGEWATIIPESAPRFADGELVGRTCSSTYGDVKEIITSYDEENMTYSYEADGLPSIFKSGKNIWSLKPNGPNRSKVSMELKMEMARITGLLMGWMIRKKMTSDLDGLMEDLKHFAETGEPHPKKKKSLMKWEKHKLKKVA